MAEPYLGNPKRTIEILQKYQFTFQKRFGQNFLIDENVLRKIISASDIRQEDFILEIGPGIGTLTQYLASRAGKVCAVEVDRSLIPVLEDTLKDWNNVVILNQDILETNLEELVRVQNGGKPVKVVANLPYYITTPIIMSLLEKKIPLLSMTVMIQKEVADRIQAKPGTKEYGALSLAVQYYTFPQTAAYVPPNCFMPRPKVGSSVITLKRYQELPLAASDEKLLFSLIRAAFNQRRKTLVNSLRNARDPVLSSCKLTKEKLEGILEQTGLNINVRGEALSLEQFVRLSDQISLMGLSE